MRFGRQLRRSIYPPWKDKYIDYDKLKKLLRDTNGSDNAEEENEWTDEDESAFVDELVTQQLEKVHGFHQEVYQTIWDRTSQCESKLDTIVKSSKAAEGVQEEDMDDDADGGDRAEDEKEKPEMTGEERDKILKEVLSELDGITKEIQELEKYSRINYTGFLKACKKHDRRRGGKYKIRPLLNVRLAALPFNKEDYSTVLFRLSTMYSFVRQNLEGDPKRGLSFGENQTGGETFTTHKFWVHKENLLEVKTIILRRLPVLVYNPQTAKVAEGNQKDPTITSIYFDNPNFSLYTNKVNHEPDAASLRLRWYGQLYDTNEVFLEKKIIKNEDSSEEQRFPIKQKYIQPFVKGEYNMEKSVAKIEGLQKEGSNAADELKKSVGDIRKLIDEEQLQPVLRANYSRTAFQIPGDDRVRISLDNHLVFIREDAIDTERPCRDPEDWHRRDIDDNKMEYPFKQIRKGERVEFPFAVLEIKIKGKKHYEWISDLMDSHLVKEAHRFSKFAHGVAILFEDYVNSFPFWLSQVETDIRRDPQQAFEEEQERKAKAAEAEFAVGSLLGGSFAGPRSSPHFKKAISSPVGSPNEPSSLQKHMSHPKITAELTRKTSIADGTHDTAEEADSDDDGPQAFRDGEVNTTLDSLGLRGLFTTFSTSKYARSKRFRDQAAQLPPGVRHPGTWIKDQGPVRVEAKVWLANQRTFVKWQHVAVLLATLSLGLYNAAGEKNRVARTLAVVYTCVAVFALAWGWGVYLWRSRLIKARSGRDFDAMLGPCVVCIGLVVALCLNFGFKYQAILEEQKRSRNETTTTGFDYLELK
ncbi:SPX-domain-containing protein [Patellaria atrata CBS 101060]|uniref:SPX-domain-containing protein n=1 Tax=Patellaria atrata CBS 101060 TaxID=1346257 RepID=A0A9P4VP35_9PEZI|nr:SPX-domain-containing protein [Patellaria atrata CBS 101060]